MNPRVIFRGTMIAERHFFVPYIEGMNKFWKSYEKIIVLYFRWPSLSLCHLRFIYEPTLCVFPSGKKGFAPNLTGHLSHAPLPLCGRYTFMNVRSQSMGSDFPLSVVACDMTVHFRRGLYLLACHPHKSGTKVRGQKQRRSFYPKSQLSAHTVFWLFF